MEDVVIFSTRMRDSFLCKLNPLIKLLFLIVFSASISIASNEVIFILSFSVSLLAFFDKLPFKELYKGTIFFFILSILIFITELSFGYIHAIAQAIKFLAIVVASLVFTDTTSPNETARSIAAFLYPILKDKANSFGFIIELTLSMIPKILESSIKILDARKCRGERMLKHPIKMLTGFSISLFIHLFDQISSYADGLESRLYTNTVKRKAKAYSYRDLITIIILLLVVGISIWIK